MRNRLTAFAAMASLFGAQANAQVPPWCESSQERDIGNGFRLTQYLFGGSSEFTLFFRPAESDIRTHGVTITAPFELMLSSLDLEGRTTPQIGFRNYEFRQSDGVRIGLGRLSVHCGEGATLSATYSTGSPPDTVRVPITFHAPFFIQRALIPQCLRDIEAAGRVRLVVAETATADPRVVIDGPIPLTRAIAEARRRWTAETTRARHGSCRMPPVPPPPF